MKRKNIESYLLAGLQAPTGLLENWKKPMEQILYLVSQPELCIT